MTDEQESYMYYNQRSGRIRGAIYEYTTHKNGVTATVTLPFEWDLPDEQVEKLENELHSAIEVIFNQMRILHDIR
jgi:hypothetical protein